MLPFLNTGILTLLSVFFFFFPVFYLPFTFDPGDLAKLLFLSLACLLVISFYSLKLVCVRKIELNFSWKYCAFTLLALIYLVSAFANSANTTLSLISPQSALNLVFLSGLYFILINNSLKLRRYFLDLTTFGAAISAIYIILMYLGLFHRDVTTPSGNLLSSAVLFLVLIIYQVPSLLVAFSKKNILTVTALIIIAIAQIFLIFHLLSDQKPVLLYQNIAFGIIKEVSLQPRSFLLGVGPSNFIAAFTLSKPASINTTPLANITFTSSSSFFTNLTSETGIINALIFIILFLAALFSLAGTFQKNTPGNFAPRLALVSLFICLFVFPASVALLNLLVILLSIVDDSNNHRISINRIGLIYRLVPLFILPLAIFAGFIGIKYYLAEANYYNSFTALNINDGTLAYNLQKRAAELNPYLDKYHLSLSQTSLLLAESLLKKENPQSEDSQKIPVLIEQSIEEARIAINLNKTNVLNWDNLTKIYSTLISFAPGAENWAVQIANQTIKLDPNNPSHYIDLAQIYKKSGRNEESQKYLNLARNLNPRINLPD